ncbi:YqhR family membrane protein [Cohnella silvisoli]|uniref:YqhR family membrane protein n=1 Tax=Cohnella silvisoli TaxID=2873699 RepID=A0ABV1KSM8_9BACL|nr:YqhR family membrane protein [Cohnella silvisoli]MCD9021342.1 hypothetical protein [Cohnella silvisoli]
MSSAQTDSNRQRSNNDPQPTNPILFSLKIGFFAGVIWGLVRWLETGLNFTRVSQAFLLDPFVQRKVLGGLYWQTAGLVMFIGMSMLAALLYVLLLKRLQGPWPGIFFGAAWWGLFYAWAGPVIGAVPPLNQIGWSSLTTDCCLFLVWGLFIGYSIAFEFHNEAGREPTKKSAGGKPQTSS